MVEDAAQTQQSIKKQVPVLELREWRVCGQFTEDETEAGEAALQSAWRVCGQFTEDETEAGETALPSA